MKVLIFGASGETGRLLVSAGLQQMHGITAFVRHPSRLKIQHENLNLFQGDVRDYKSVEAALEGHDGVVSALGARTPIGRDLIIVKGINNIVKAMQRQRVNRFIYQSFLGVKEFRSELGFVIDKIAPLALKGSIKDHEEKEQFIINSHLMWTIVRCAMLTNGPATTNYREGEHITSDTLLPTISRADVANFMIKQLTDSRFNYKKPRLMY